MPIRRAAFVERMHVLLLDPHTVLADPRLQEGTAMDDLLRQVIHVFVEGCASKRSASPKPLLRMEESPSTIPVEIEELYRQAHSLRRLVRFAGHY